MKGIAILTRDCAGVNTAIWAVARAASYYSVEVWGIYKGYNGLIDGKYEILNWRSVSGILSLGGSILKTSRAERFRNSEERKKAYLFVKEHNIDGLIVVGGNGSLTAAHVFYSEYQVPVIGIPATIDDDINGIDRAIGSDTAINVATDAMDKIRDTANSLERILIIDVMGRASGYIALQVALAGGCEEVIVPEKEYDFDVICQEIEKRHNQGKISWLIVLTEGKSSAHIIAKVIREKTGLTTRVTVLGYIQRGGSPTAMDRLMAIKLGSYAVETLIRGGANLCVHNNNEQLSLLPLEFVIKPKKIDIEFNYRLIKMLT